MTNANEIDGALARAEWDILCADTPQDGMDPSHCLMSADEHIASAMRLIDAAPEGDTAYQRRTLWCLIDRWRQVQGRLAGEPYVPPETPDSPTVQELSDYLGGA